MPPDLESWGQLTASGSVARVPRRHARLDPGLNGFRAGDSHQHCAWRWAAIRQGEGLRQVLGALAVGERIWLFCHLLCQAHRPFHVLDDIPCPSRMLGALGYGARVRRLALKEGLPGSQQQSGGRRSVAIRERSPTPGAQAMVPRQAIKNARHHWRASACWLGRED